MTSGYSQDEPEPRVWATYWVQSLGSVVLSELVGNAVRHARTEFTVVATLTAGTLRIEVFDLDTRPPSLLGLDSGSTSGRGLHIVAGIASEWGWQTADGPDAQAGKVVWAEFTDSEAQGIRDEVE